MSSCRVIAASTLARSTTSTCSGVIAVTMPSRRTPAECTTAVSGCPVGMSASTPASAWRSATSQAANVTSAPSAVSSADNRCACSELPPLLLTSSSRRAPCSVTRWRATWPPMAPAAPVTSIVPSGSSACGTVSTILPMCLAWLMVRNASRAWRTSHAATGNGVSAPDANSASTSSSICLIRSGPASIRSNTV